MAVSLSEAAVLVPGRGIYVFSGPVAVKYAAPTGSVTWNCTFDVKTAFDIDPVGTGIEMMFLNAGMRTCTGGAVLTPLMPWHASAAGAPPPFPGAVPDAMFPWAGTPPALAVPIQVNNFDIQTPLGTCGVTNIPVTYDNNGPGTASSFAFGPLVFGACVISGTVSAVPAAGGFTGTAADIDVFR